MRRHPGAARFRPARRCGDRQLESQSVGLIGRKTECLLPFGRHVDEAFIDDLRRTQIGIEILDTANSDALHPGKILGNAVHCDVAVHPVPPDARAGAVGRIAELLLKRGFRRGGPFGALLRGNGKRRERRRGGKNDTPPAKTGLVGQYCSPTVSLSLGLPRLRRSRRPAPPPCAPAPCARGSGCRDMS